MIKTIEEFKAYLVEMTKRVDEVASKGWPEAASVESLSAHMWQQFLPHAIAFWTISGVLNQIAECIDPPKEEDNADEGEEDDE